MRINALLRLTFVPECEALNMMYVILPDSNYQSSVS